MANWQECQLFCNGDGDTAYGWSYDISKGSCKTYEQANFVKNDFEDNVDAISGYKGCIGKAMFRYFIPDF